MTRILIQLSGFLLSMYPASFRMEFREQMLLDFSDLLDEASKRRRSYFVLVCIRELVEFPVNLLKVHYRERVLFKNLRPEGANHVVGGAIGFGLGFAFLSLADWWISGSFYSFWKPIIENLSASAGDASSNDWLYMFPFATYFMLSSLTFGTLLACFLGTRANFWRYVFAGAFSWLIPETLSYVAAER